MEAVEWVLIEGAKAVRGIASAIGAGAERAWSAVDLVVNPVLAPAVGVANRAASPAGDLVYGVAGWLPSWVSLVGLSMVVGVLMVPVFGRLSNQKAIAASKDAIKANLLALKLYRDELHVTFLAQWRLVKAVGRMQWYVLGPVLLLMPPMLLVLAQMGIRHQWRALRPGESAQVRMEVGEPSWDVHGVRLIGGDGVAVEAGPVAGGGEIWWRIRAERPGRHELVFEAGGARIGKELVVGESQRRVSAVRPGSSWTERLLHPVELPLTRSCGVKSIEVMYPLRESWVDGANVWVLTFFVVSMAAALVSAPWFGVKF